MAYSFALIKKILMTLLAFMISAPSIPIHAAMQPAQTQDVFVQQFKGHFDSEAVKYENGKLMLYASRNPDAYLNVPGAIFWGGLAAAFCGLGYVLGARGIEDRKEGGRNAMIFLLLAVVEGGVGLAIFANIYRHISVALKTRKIPYFTFDAEGLACVGKRCLLWGDVERIYISEGNVLVGFSDKDKQEMTDSTSEAEPRRVKKMELFDKNGNLLFWLLEDDSECPLSFRDLVILIEHYVSVYGKKSVKGVASSSHA